ncbi:unnamed protein product [Haemonchus placei]|uniref:N-acetylglucosaminyl transferase component-domain-containing protein n=1 Tax=Haemonchus placei TaxID=6290 RepID=A0A0N4WKZ7_HAEPC|nr:unnamed protein product [Haemonchus placei]
MHLRESVPEIMRILRRFETANNSVGAASTHMWLLPYLPYVGEKEHGSIEFKYRYLPEFFKLTEYRRWSHFVNLGDHADCLAERPSCLQKFVFSTGFHNAVTWTERLNLLEQWRDIASEYRHLNLTVYEDFSMYSDQSRLYLRFVVYQSLCVLDCYFHICSGVFGCLVYLNIDLDPISMTTLLMAIGFSVDFVAHITWHYYKGDFPSKRERLRHALASIAWPMFQSGMSTMISIVVLTAVHAYMVKVFVKVIWFSLMLTNYWSLIHDSYSHRFTGMSVVVLVVFLGMCHGLIVLPVVFAALPFKKAKVSHEKPHQLTIMDVKPPLGRQSNQA